MIGNYPHLPHPLEDDVQAFVDEIEARYQRGDLTTAQYHVTMGKALGYVECRFSLDQMSTEEAYELACRITETI